jgi:bifunctional DNA-binding transcriptional regulator/antitoxin component of YhaV-PrlF toxin-antitoxin module
VRRQREPTVSLPEGAARGGEVRPMAGDEGGHHVARRGATATGPQAACRSRGPCRPGCRDGVGPRRGGRESGCARCCAWSLHARVCSQEARSARHARTSGNGCHHRLACVILMKMRQIRITTGGQISVPAELRRRWGTRTLVLDDRGDHAVLRPAPDDPIAAVRGIFAGRLPPSEELRRQAREEETAAERRRA